MTLFLKWILLPVTGLVLLVAMSLLWGVHRERSSLSSERAAWAAAGLPLALREPGRPPLPDAQNRVAGWLEIAERALEEEAHAPAGSGRDSGGSEHLTPDVRALMEEVLRRPDRAWPTSADGPLDVADIERVRGAANASARLLLTAASEAEARGDVTAQDRMMAGVIQVASDAAAFPGLTTKMLALDVLRALLSEFPDAAVSSPRTSAAAQSLDLRAWMLSGIAEDGLYMLRLLDEGPSEAWFPVFAYVDPLDQRWVLRMYREYHEALAQSWLTGINFRVPMPPAPAIRAQTVAPLLDSALHLGASADAARLLWLLKDQDPEAVQRASDPYTDPAAPLQAAQAPGGGWVGWSVGIYSLPERLDTLLPELVVRSGTQWLPATLEPFRPTLDAATTR